MGCGGSDEKKAETVAVETEGDSDDHVYICVTCGLKEGVTYDAIKEFAAKEVEVAQTIPECLHFQLEGDEAAFTEKKAILNEIYSCGAGHMAINKALSDAGLVEGVFANYDFVEMVFCMSQKNYDTPGYAEMLEGFKQACPNVRIIIHDMPAKVALPMKAPGSHISITVTCGLQEGKTLADVKALCEKEVAVAKEKVPGCVYFGLAMNEETMASKTGLLCEKYATAADHMAINGALDAADLVKSADGVFATYDIKEFKFMGPQAEFDHPGYAELLEQFGGVAPVVKIVNDLPGKVAK